MRMRERDVGRKILGRCRKMVMRLKKRDGIEFVTIFRGAHVFRGPG